VGGIDGGAPCEGHRRGEKEMAVKTFEPRTNGRNHSDGFGRRCLGFLASGLLGFQSSAENALNAKSAGIGSSKNRRRSRIVSWRSTCPDGNKQLLHGFHILRRGGSPSKTSASASKRPMGVDDLELGFLGNRKDGKNMLNKKRRRENRSSSLERRTAGPLLVLDGRGSNVTLRLKHIGEKRREL